MVDTRVRGDAGIDVMIGSISDQDWYISRTHGVYHIPARQKGEEFAELRVSSRGDIIDLGDNRRMPFTISAREIADDLIQDLQDHGVFLCAAERPNAEELAAAKARREAFHQKTCDRSGFDVGARTFIPRDFGFAPAGVDCAGARTRVGLRADADGRLPGVR